MKKLLCILLPLLLILLSSCESETNSKTAIHDNALADGQICIVLDSGHGLSDSGALNEQNLGEVTEADINFAIVTKLEKVLTSRGYTVILTHDGVTKPDTEYDDGEDTYGPSERSDFANSKPADLFISIHCDSFPDNPDVNGIRVYYPVDTPNSSSYDKLLAEALKSGIEDEFPDDKKVILRDMHGEDCYTVLYKTLAPSVLIEAGFITNTDDAKKLLDENRQQSLAEAIANAADSYLSN